MPRPSVTEVKAQIDTHEAVLLREMERNDFTNKKNRTHNDWYLQEQQSCY